jgi:hypothetical protein
MSENIDLSFNFYSDTPLNKDPDSHSPTLRKYHKILWSKPLPNGHLFELTDNNPKSYLYHAYNQVEHHLSSDAITHSYKKVKRMSHIIREVPTDKVDDLISYGSTIGAYIIFPSKRINNQMTINGARGCNSRIGDRFDLTLECIRLFYENKENPLYSVFQRYLEFFNLFSNFKGYVDFFLLQDLVSSNYSSIKYHLPHRDFEESPLPQDLNEYLEYRENTKRFVKARGQRMLTSVSS